MRRFLITLLVVLLARATPASAAFVMHHSYDGWAAAAGSFDTITFGELPPFSLVSTQYQDMGVLFVDTDGNWTEGPEFNPYPQDGFGMDGNKVADIVLLKSANAFGAHFPGILRYRLYSNGVLIHDTDLIGASQYNNFRGVISSDLVFDRVLVTANPPSGKVFLDNIYIGFVPVPGPAGAAGLWIWMMMGADGRRRVRRQGVPMHSPA